MGNLPAFSCSSPGRETGALRDAEGGAGSQSSAMEHSIRAGLVPGPCGWVVPSVRAQVAAPTATGAAPRLIAA